MTNYKLNSLNPVKLYNTNTNRFQKKRKVMMKNPLILVFALLILTACGQRQSESQKAEEFDVGVGELQISPESMNEIIQNMASPIELAAQISSLDIPFSSDKLINPDHFSTSASSIRLAHNLGTLNADLGFLIMYEKTGDAMNYLSGIIELAEALQIGHLIDVAAIQNLATIGFNLDSLIFISVNSFNNMDDYLHETGRSSLSAMMIAGVWMEGMFLSTQMAAQNNNEILRSLIGEQKLVLMDLLLILNSYKEEKEIADLINDLEIMKDVFDEVKITYEVEQPKTIEKDGMLMVVQGESSKVMMSDETLQKLIDVTQQIRNIHLHINPDA